MPKRFGKTQNPRGSRVSKLVENYEAGLASSGMALGGKVQNHKNPVEGTDDDIQRSSKKFYKKRSSTLTSRTSSSNEPDVGDGGVATKLIDEARQALEEEKRLSKQSVLQTHEEKAGFKLPEVKETSNTRQLIGAKANQEVVTCLIETLKYEDDQHFLKGAVREYLSPKSSKSDAHVLFYGTSMAQRANVMALKYYISKGGSNKVDISDSKEMFEFIAAKLPAGEKEDWGEVSNFWLKDNLGLAFKAESFVGMIDFSLRDKNNKSVFRQYFEAAQHKMRKSIQDDVHRLDAQYKSGNKSQEKPTEAMMASDLLIRRMCKWMLHVAAYDHQPVAYALDELELLPVTKAQALESGKMPVCTSELREVFRFIDKFDNITFYKNLKIVPPPWEQQAEEVMLGWAEYAMHLTRKLLIDFEWDRLCIEKAEAMLSAWDEKDWARVIALYKEIRPSELRAIVHPENLKRIKAMNKRKLPPEGLFSDEAAYNHTKYLSGRISKGLIFTKLTELHATDTTKPSIVHVSRTSPDKTFPS